MILDERTHHEVDARLALARRLLTTARPLGRLYLAGLAVTPRKVLACKRLLAPSFERDLDIKRREAEIAVYEAEQRAHGFGVEEQELRAAEVGVEPVAVERWPNAGHGAPLAGLCEERRRISGERSPFGWFEIRAEYRDDTRWRGAYVEARIFAGEVATWLGRRVDSHDAIEEAVLFVGRWARVGRAAIAEPQPAGQLQLFETRR